MFKILSLSATIAAFSFFSATASVDKIDTIKDSLALIAQAKTDSMLELKTTITVAHKATQHFHNKLGTAYEAYKIQVVSLLDSIFQSDEFAITLDKVTDLYVECVVNQHMNFYDIIVDSTNYPLEEKIKAILEQACPALNDDAAQIL